MRSAEVCTAIVLLLIFWKVTFPRATAQGNNVLLTVCAWLYTVLIGGVYIGGSLFALVTVPLGNQLEYFRQMIHKIDYTNEW